MTIQPFDPADPGVQAILGAVWNAACGPALAVTPRLVAYNGQPVAVIAQRGCLELAYGQVQGFVLASAVPGASVLGNGWIDALAVVPEQRGRGLGSHLLQWAEAWLLAHGCSHVQLGGSLHPWTAGLPLELNTRPFFMQRGYTGNDYVWDVAHHLTAWRRHEHAAASADVRPLESGQEHELLDFLHLAFPGRWEWECTEFFRIGGRRSDCLVLRTALGIEGFCWVTLEDSLRPIDRFYPDALPRPWGQLGPLGVSSAARGKGYGAALLDAGLEYLQARGVDGCVIDWTGLLEFYGKWGFRPFREYAVLQKEW